MGNKEIEGRKDVRGEAEEGEETVVKLDIKVTKTKFWKDSKSTVYLAYYDCFNDHKRTHVCIYTTFSVNDPTSLGRLL